MRLAALALAVTAIAVGCGSARGDELAVTQADFQPGEITLVVRNSAEDAARVAQVILNDAFVDFRASARTIAPGDVQAFVLFYPWIRGESYEITLLTATGRTVDYEIEEAAS